jgi:hypothetical protein
MMTDEPVNDEKKPARISITDGMDDFRDEVQKFRVKIWSGDQSYEEDVIDDKEYKELLEKADLTEGDHELYLKKYRAKAEIAKKLDAERFGDNEAQEEEAEEDLQADVLGEDEGESDEEVPEFRLLFQMMSGTNGNLTRRISKRKKPFRSKFKS